MERSEPTLVPEWLRSTGSVTGGGNSAHHFATSSSHTDISPRSTRNRSSKNTSDYESPRSAFLDRTSSSNSRRNLVSNGFPKHDKESNARAYSSFSRSHRDKDRDREKDRLVIEDQWDHDSSHPLANILINRVEKDVLRRSHSVVSRKQVDVLPRRVASDSRNGDSNKHNNVNGMVSGASIIGGIHKAVFDKDFPSLGTEPDIGRVPSPGLSMAVQSLPIGNSSLIGGEGWTSALAEVPMITGSNSTGSSSVQQTVVSAPASGLPSTTAGLNMAEALAQAPSRARTTPQLSVNTQRLEELAIKQSRQLIPVTPSMPKSSVLNSSDKSKPKTVVRTSDMIAASKTGQQQPSSSHLANHSLRGHVRSDPPTTSHGKFLVLKPARENGASPTSRDVSSPTNNASSRVASIQLGVAHSVASAPSISPNYPKLSTMERKAAALSLNSGPTAEKRPSFSQAQSRHDFFNLMRKKTSVNSSAVLPDSGPEISSSNTESEVSSAPVKSHAIENGGQVTGNGGNTCEEVESPAVGEKHLGTNASICPDEEEAAFLRSLGWEESAGDDEGLTEEEINAFYQEYMKLKPSLKLQQGMQAKLLMLHGSRTTSLGGASSKLSSSDSESEA